MEKVANSIVAVTYIDDREGIPINAQSQHHSSAFRVQTLHYHNKTQDTDPAEGKVTVPGIAVPTVNNQDGILIDYYTQYNGNGSTEDGWPAKDRWISFMDMYV